MIVIAKAVVFVELINPAPDFGVSCANIAVMVALPAADGVKSPELLIVPALAGLTDQATGELKLPVPATVALQVAV